MNRAIFLIKSVLLSAIILLPLAKVIEAEVALRNHSPQVAMANALIGLLVLFIIFAGLACTQKEKKA